MNSGRVSVVVSAALLGGAIAMSATAPSKSPSGTTAVATFGGGCYWCIEAVFERVEGVKSAVSGFMGGTRDNPTYEEVCTGRTGHAEVVRVEFDPAVISYEQLLEWFWAAHDPTQVNRQGADIGTQYRSVIFVHDAEQRRIAEASRDRLAKSGKLNRPVATAIEPAGVFWPAKESHQDYYRRNSSAGYCRAVIAPKLKKLGLEGP